MTVVLSLALVIFGVLAILALVLRGAPPKSGPNSCAPSQSYFAGRVGREQVRIDDRTP